MTLVRACTLAGVVALAAAGCESTQDKAAKLSDEGKEVFARDAVDIGKTNGDVKVLDRTVLTDQNGSAAVLVLRSRARSPQAQVPVSIDVRGANGKSVFRNDTAGLEKSLTTVATVAPGDTMVWVNDQVVAASKPKSVVARVGMPRAKASAKIPKLRTSGVKLEQQPATGLAAVGYVHNDSKVEQRELVLHGAARRGDKIVAGGRAQIRRLKPGKRSLFRMFFIGDPRGAKLEISVPPTRLR
jgi:hypothetical protein